jgi:tetratricopeptide (TPR) repeat protein
MPLADALAAWRRAAVWAAGGVFALLLTGCASPGHPASPYPPDLPQQVELVDTPFFPDDSHYCGPAALATSLSAAGLSSQPQALIDQVFLPGRQGSLQVEMLAAARRQGAVATLIPASTEALWRELAAGHPVVVLQNLGLSWAPSWHYAVVVGYDARTDTVLLRSGPMKRQELSLRTFMYTWNRSERWAFVTTRPGQLPVTATEAETVRALVALERNVPASAAVQAYRAGVARWPANPTLAMGLGNALYAAGDKQDAEAVFGQVIERHRLAAAYNNLARLLLERGNIPQARAVVESGLPVAGPLRQTLQETLEAIETANQAPR